MTELIWSDLPDTRVSFPSGDMAGRGTVVGTDVLADGRQGFVVDVTPFHPLDHTWPDQPSDLGTVIRPDGGIVQVVDTLTGANSVDGGLLVGEAIDVRRGDAERRWFVVHVTEATAAAPVTGERVTLSVDPALRSSLSRGHTACHLAAFALNEVAADCWTKDAERLDSRGNPDLDQSAITVSKIEPNGSFDAYRFNKSLRRKGFDSAMFLANMDERRQQAQSLVDNWMSTGADVVISTDGDDRLTARRRWECALPDGLATVPCGGTHASSLAEIGTITVRWVQTEEGLEIRTETAPLPS